MNNYFVNITEGWELKHDVLNNFNVDLTEITEKGTHQYKENSFNN